MPGNCLVTIDIGTSSVKASVTDSRGKMLALVRHDITYRSVPEAGMFAREFVPDELWQTACEATSEAIHTSGMKPKDIAGVSSTSQREGIVLLDANGRELYGGPNIDLRAVMEGLMIDNKHGPLIHSVTGHLPSMLFAPARIKWFQNNHPEIFDQVRWVLTISDWINFRLTGELTGELCSASETGLLSITDRTRCTDLFRLLDLPENIFPQLIHAGSPVGTVSGKASTATSLPADTPVIQGAPDTHCGLLGMGVCATGSTGVVMGWSAPVQMIMSQPMIDPESRIWSGCHVFPDRWLLESNSGESGNAFRWLMQQMYLREGITEQQAYALMDEEALSVSPGAEGVIASLGPGLMDMTRLNMNLGGLFLPLPLSVSNVSRGHLARAVIENICFAIKANLAQIEAVSGMEAACITLAGNLTGSRCFRHSVADILGRPVSLAEVKDISSLGTAMLAAAGTGLYSGIEEAVEAMRSDTQVIEPDAMVSAEYDEYYERWLTMMKQLQEMEGVLN